MNKMTKAINYSGKVLPDGHLSLPVDIRKEMGLAVHAKVKVTLEIDHRKEKAIKAFGAWADRSDIKGGTEYTKKIRAEWEERTEDI